MTGTIKRWWWARRARLDFGRLRPLGTYSLDVFERACFAVGLKPNVLLSAPIEEAERMVKGAAMPKAEDANAFLRVIYTKGHRVDLRKYPAPVAQQIYAAALAFFLTDMLMPSLRLGQP